MASEVALTAGRLGAVLLTRSRKAWVTTWIKRIAQMYETPQPLPHSKIVTKGISPIIKAYRITRRSTTSWRRISRSSPRVSKISETRAHLEDLLSRQSIKAQWLQRPPTLTHSPPRLTCPPLPSLRTRALSARSVARSVPFDRDPILNLPSKPLNLILAISLTRLASARL